MRLFTKLVLNEIKILCIFKNQSITVKSVLPLEYLDVLRSTEIVSQCFLILAELLKIRSEHFNRNDNLPGHGLREPECGPRLRDSYMNIPWNKRKETCKSLEW